MVNSILLNNVCLDNLKLYERAGLFSVSEHTLYQGYIVLSANWLSSDDQARIPGNFPLKKLCFMTIS